MPPLTLAKSVLQKCHRPSCHLVNYTAVIILSKYHCNIKKAELLELSFREHMYSLQLGYLNEGHGVKSFLLSTEKLFEYV